MNMYGDFIDPYGPFGNEPEVPKNSDGEDVYDPPMIGCLYSLSAIIVLTLVALLVVLLTGCSPRVIENTIVKRDTVYHNHTTHDSVYVKDSVFVHLWHAGDTVYVERDRWHTAWKERIVRDTAYVSRTDTIVKTVVAKPQRALSGWQWFQIWAGRLAMIALAVAAAWVIVRRRFFRT